MSRQGLRAATFLAPCNRPLYEFIAEACGASELIDGRDWRDAVKKGVITASEGEKVAAAQEAVVKVVEVDDFAPNELSPIFHEAADMPARAIS